MLHSLERYNKRERDLRLPLLLIAGNRSDFIPFSGYRINEFDPSAPLGMQSQKVAL